METMNKAIPIAQLDREHPDRLWIVLDPQGAGNGVRFVGPFDSARAANEYKEKCGGGFLGMLNDPAQEA